MDRNPYIPLAKVRHCESLSARRAWIEISAWGPHGTGAESLSARRAWIEIWPVAILLISVRVALRKESVDRNMGASYGRTAKMVSLSARRAWIEIALAPEQNTAKQRSLSARRAWIEIPDRPGP